MSSVTRASASQVPGLESETNKLTLLKALERKVLWLSAWTIHNANHLRPSRDGLKVGGHQASSASLATLMTALYFDILEAEDRVAVKPHASPVYHAIQYLLGKQSREKLENFRSLGGAQSYPSRTKDSDDVDFSTGSVGLGVALTAFASLVQDYVSLKDWLPEGRRTGRMVALVGDAELDEGNVFECMMEGWKHDLRNTWWVIDYNRQSLDAVVNDRLFGQIDRIFGAMGWEVETLKYGKRLERAFAKRGGDQLRRWIDDCPNSLYSALTYQGGAAWRRQLLADIGDTGGIKALLDEEDDESLGLLMTNLAGNDMDSVLEAFEKRRSVEQPTCFLAYTIKGYGLPFAGHKDNHAGLMNEAQMEVFRARHEIPTGQEWEPFAGMEEQAEALRRFLVQVPMAARDRQLKAAAVPVPADFPLPRAETLSTQAGFGQIMGELAKQDSLLADRLITTSPDVTVSTNLGAFVNRRGIFDRRPREDTFKEQKVVSAQRWSMSPQGQHIELGIAEHNLFGMLAALGLSHSLFGCRLLPVGTLYDPFIQRGLDVLNYACYQDARFLVVATPSGITLAPEGGAHQSISTPLIGMAQDKLAYFEPAYVDELSVLMEWSFDYMQRDGAGRGDSVWLRDKDGGSVYLRLSTRAIAQPERSLSEAERENIVAGGYWLRRPAEGAGLAIVATGAVMPEALEAWQALQEDLPGAGLLAVTSPDRLNAEWQAAQRSRRAGQSGALSTIETLLAPLAADAGLVTVLDGHPATLGWIGGVRGQMLEPLGVEHFGQSGDIPDLYRAYGLDSEAILDACAAVLLRRAGR